VRRGVGTDTRIGRPFLFPGCGYGGSCFPKDVKAIIHTASEHGYDFRILKSVEAVNADQKTILFRKIHEHFKGELNGLTLAVWGLSFKPKTDDMREAPSIPLINTLLDHGVKIRATDPEAIQEAKKIFGDRISYHLHQYECLEGADALVVVTEWAEFQNPDFERIKSLLKNPVIFDGRNIYITSRVWDKTFTYYPIGFGDLKKN
jgi:UDPglucose 6-dehydrogenase